MIAAGKESKKEIFEYNTTVITFYIIYENPGIQENLGKVREELNFPEFTNNISLFKIHTQTNC